MRAYPEGMLLLAEMPSEILWKSFELSDSENMHLKCVTILDAYISESKRVLRQERKSYNNEKRWAKEVCQI